MMRRLSILTVVFGAVLVARTASAVRYDNQTLSGTVVIPANQTSSFLNTITLNNAVVEIEGYLRNEQNPVTVTGSGEIYIRAPEGIWTDGWVYSHLTIDPNVEVFGERGGRFYPQGVNKGTLAAIAGGSGGIFDDFAVSLDDFRNEGLIEVQPDAEMGLHLLDGTFENTGTIRVQPGGMLQLSMDETPVAPGQLGAIDNNGVAELNFFKLAGAGTLELGGNGEYRVGRYSTVTGSTLNIAPTATVKITSDRAPVFRLSGATINGNLTSAVGSDTDVDGGLTLNGEWLLDRADVIFRNDQSVAGAGRFATASATSRLVVAGGTTTFGPEIDLNVRPGGALQIAYLSPTAGTLVLQGDADIDAGSLRSATISVINDGHIHARNAGKLDVLSGSFTNNGTITVDTGGTLNIGGNFTNNGTISVEDGAVVLNAFPSIMGMLSIVDSTIYAAAFEQKLSQLQALPRTRSEIVTAGSFYGDQVDLEGMALTIADQDNMRWALGGGGIENGVIESADGFELRTVALPVGLGNVPVLRNIELNANARVTTGRVLQVNENVTGSGKLIVDGGTLRFGGRGNQGAPMTSDAVAMVEPVSGVVEIYGPMDNTGRTILLKSGVEWHLDVVRSDGIIGGRIEAEPGAELRVGPFSGSLHGVTLAAPLRISGGQLSNYDGIALDGATIYLRASGRSTSVLDFRGPQMLDGVGEIRFEADAGADPLTPSRIRILGNPDAAGLTIGPGIVVRTGDANGSIGGGHAGTVPAPLTNSGTLMAENGHTLELFVSNFTQRGTVRTAVDSTVVVNDNMGANEGVFELGGGSIAIFGQSFENAASGEVRGNGVLDVRETSFSNSGVIAPDDELQILGNYTQAPTGMLQLAVTSEEGQMPDLLAIEGAAALAGLVALDHVGTVAPALGDSWTLLASTGALSGEFAAAHADWLPAELALLLEYESNAVTARLVERLTGDFDGDADVDAADYVVWRKTDGMQDGYSRWRANFGRTAGSSSAEGLPRLGGPTLAVPEPAMVWLLPAVAVWIWLRRVRPIEYDKPHSEA